MKKSLRTLFLIFLGFLLLPLPAWADSGPKPQLTVRVAHAPAGVYYLDLLVEGDPEPKTLDYSLDWNYPDAAERAALDPALLQALRDAVPEGWTACVAQGNHGIPITARLTGEGNLHTFGYVGVPKTYRVLLVTDDGESWVSAPMTRQALQTSATVDWTAKTLSAPPVWMGYILQFLATCVPTLLIEALLLLLFGYSWKTSWRPFLAVNLVTQGALALLFSILAVGSGFNYSRYLFLFLPAELVIAVTEALLYRRFLTEQGKSCAVKYALWANGASALLGWFLAVPVWEFVVSIS